MQKEISSIANLLIEDENYIEQIHNTSSQELCSWLVKDFNSNSPKVHPKLNFPSLPPVIPPRKSCISLSISHILPQSSDTITPKPFKSKFLKLEDKRERVKITELRSIESLKNTFIEPPNRQYFLPIHVPKINSIKRSKRPEIHSSTRILKEDFLISKNKRQHKMIIGLSYPIKYYERFISNHHANKMKAKNSSVPYNHNSCRPDDINEFLNKITSPNVRSKSMFSEGFSEKITMKNKFLLSPLLKDI